MMTYKDSIVAFYDILGFGTFVAQHATDPKKVHDLFGKLSRSAKFDEWEVKDLGQRFIHFSDTFVRTTPIFADDGGQTGFGPLFHEILSAVHIQMSLVTDGIFLRGSITHGSIRHTRDELFGPALIAAYRLETDVAVFPRIVVDPATLMRMRNTDDFCKDGHDQRTEQEYCESLLRQGDDGIWFVDYLRVAKDEVDEPDYYFDFLRHHKDAILSASSSPSIIGKVSHKYAWLVSYHNSTTNCIDPDEFRYRGLKLEDYLISSTEFPLHHEGSEGSTDKP